MATPHSTNRKVKTTQPPNPELTLGTDTGPHLPVLAFLAFARILPADVFLFQVDVLVASACLRVLAWTQAGSQHGLSLPSQKVEQVTIATVLSDDQDRA